MVLCSQGPISLADNGTMTKGPMFSGSYVPQRKGQWNYDKWFRVPRAMCSITWYIGNGPICSLYSLVDCGTVTNGSMFPEPSVTTFQDPLFPMFRGAQCCSIRLKITLRSMCVNIKLNRGTSERSTRSAPCSSDWAKDVTEVDRLQPCLSTAVFKLSCAAFIVPSLPPSLPTQIKRINASVDTMPLAAGKVIQKSVAVSLRRWRRKSA